MPIGAIIGGIGSVVGGLAQASAAKKAASAQTAAANNQLALQREMHESSREDLQPYREAGLPAQNLLNYYLGMTDQMPTTGGTPAAISVIPGSRSRLVGIVQGGQGTPERFSVNGQLFDTREQAEAYANANLQGGAAMPGFQETPGFRFALQEGLDAVEAGAAARGGLRSGATMQALQQRGIGMANQEFGNYLSRLEGQATRGQNAAAQSATINTNTAQMGSNAYANMGNAQAAGAIGVGNAFSGMINNGIGLWQYQNMLNRFPGAN